MKTCTGCKREMPRDSFQKNRSRPDGLHGHCRECISTQNRKWRDKNPDRVKSSNRKYRLEHPEVFRKIHLKKNFGITPEEYEQMVADQDGKCAICRSACASGKRLAIDHCHETGRIRGLLCNNCNWAIGLFRDDPEIAISAAEYLAAHKPSVETTGCH